jgi:hypothetical protein
MRAAAVMQDKRLKPHHFWCYEVWRTPGFNVYLGDGSVRFIRSDTDEQTLRRLISPGQ